MINSILKYCFHIHKLGTAYNFAGERNDKHITLHLFLDLQL